MKDRSYKKRKRIRNRKWDADSVDTVSRESRSKREDSEDTMPDIDPETLFSDISPNAILVSPYGLLAFVERNGEEQLCRVDDGLTDGKRSILAPGDAVLVDDRGDEHVITAVAPRRTKLSRPALGGGREKVLAANIDAVLIVASAAEPAFRPGLIDRYLIASNMGGVPSIVCLNKMDLVETEPESLQVYRDLLIPVATTCCVSGKGVDHLRDIIAEKTVVLTGHSGVGKSSLLNALAPNLAIETQDVSRHTQKGRHTTTASRMYTLDNGTRIIDTPGIRQMGLWNLEPQDVDRYFNEIAEAAIGCKFRNCSHTHEPGCAIRNALESGAVTEARYKSYLRIRDSLAKEGAHQRNEAQFRMPGPRPTGD